MSKEIAKGKGLPQAAIPVRAPERLPHGPDSVRRLRLADLETPIRVAVATSPAIARNRAIPVKTLLYHTAS